MSGPDGFDSRMAALREATLAQARADQEIRERAARPDASDTDRAAATELDRAMDRSTRRIVQASALGALLVLAVTLLAVAPGDRPLILAIGAWFLLPFLVLLLVPRLARLWWGVRVASVCWLVLGSGVLLYQLVREVVAGST